MHPHDDRRPPEMLMAWLLGATSLGALVFGLAEGAVAPWVLVPVLVVAAAVAIDSRAGQPR